MKKEYYSEYYYLERSHWWFKARLEILELLLQQKIVQPNLPSIKILNAGVATGATTTMLEKYGNVTSLEYDKDCCEFLKSKLNIEAINCSLTDLPFDDATFDLICAFDVIEHIEDDDLAIKEIERVLKDDGLIFLTVPMYNFLWSQHDEINHHYRRYTLKSLQYLIENNGFRIKYKSYFNFFLFFPISILRLSAKVFNRKTDNSNKESTGSDFELFQSSGIVNNVLFRVFKTEKIFLKRNIGFPFGISGLIIGSKKISE